MTDLSYKPVANGLHTDHPYPDLPFVDDSHLPLDDPQALEAIGRHQGDGRWGRHDDLRQWGWLSFTSDSDRPELSWLVRYHPEHGRSVVLYRSEDQVTGIQHTMAIEQKEVLLYRAGGYGWDGQDWRRPPQLWDAAAEKYVLRRPPAASTVTSRDLLEGGSGRPERGRVLSIADLDVDAELEGRWIDHLALWASRRADRGLGNNVVSLTAPELSADALIGAAEVADIAGISPSTLRSYISRGEGEVPQEQAIVRGRSMWARPVAEEWADKRRRSRENVAAAASSGEGELSPVGVEELRRKAGRWFSTHLTSPNVRKRWALRWRGDREVEKVADELGTITAVNIGNIVPLSNLATTICQAMLHEFSLSMKIHAGASGRPLDWTAPEQPGGAPLEKWYFFDGFDRVAQMLGWLIRHDPGRAGSTINSIIGDAERELGVPRQVVERSLRVALARNKPLEPDALEQFLARALPPRPS